MNGDIHRRNKALIGRLRAALYDCDADELSGQLRALFAPDCAIQLAFPFECLDGPDALIAEAYRPLIDAMPDLERRDFIVMAGAADGENWVGCGGHYIGVFAQPWLDIPPPNMPSSCATPSSFAWKMTRSSKCKRSGISRK